ncbi:MAG: hypothetical protein QM658_13300 [Gordonia sp. (in: high G+C Gram-positive bacteria)]
MRATRFGVVVLATAVIVSGTTVGSSTVGDASARTVRPAPAAPRAQAPAPAPAADAAVEPAGRKGARKWSSRLLADGAVATDAASFQGAAAEASDQRADVTALLRSVSGGVDASAVREVAVAELAGLPAFAALGRSASGATSGVRAFRVAGTNALVVVQVADTDELSTALEASTVHRAADDSLRGGGSR